MSRYRDSLFDVIDDLPSPPLHLFASSVSPKPQPPKASRDSPTRNRTPITSPATKRIRPKLSVPKARRFLLTRQSSGSVGIRKKPNYCCRLLNVFGFAVVFNLYLMLYTMVGFGKLNDFKQIVETKVEDAVSPDCVPIKSKPTRLGCENSDDVAVPEMHLPKFCLRYEDSSLNATTIRNYFKALEETNSIPFNGPQSCSNVTDQSCETELMPTKLCGFYDIAMNGFYYALFIFRYPEDDDRRDNGSLMWNYLDGVEAREGPTAITTLPAAVCPSPKLKLQKFDRSEVGLSDDVGKWASGFGKLLGKPHNVTMIDAEDLLHTYDGAEFELILRIYYEPCNVLSCFCKMHVTPSPGKFREHHLLGTIQAHQSEQ